MTAIVPLTLSFFLVLVALEAVWARVNGHSLHHPSELSADLATATLHLALRGTYRALLFSGLTVAHTLATAPIDNSPTAAFACFILVDLAYYVWHRFAHRTNLGWASHVVHHQSEAYNLAVALRLSVTGIITTLPFFAPIAVLGFSPVLILGCLLVVLGYQFPLHTQLVRSLGPLEWVFNTPSSHRVHHGTASEHLDQNFGGVFIIWDRLFGTYTPETGPISYGVLAPIGTMDPVWANLSGWARNLHGSWVTPRWRDKVALWFWAPATPIPGRRPIRHSRGHRPVGVQGALPYVFIHLAPMLALGVWIQRPIDFDGRAALVALLVVSTISFMALLQRRWWALPVELVRLGGLALAGTFLLTHPSEALIWALFIAASAFWTIRSHHLLFRRGFQGLRT